MLNVITAKFCSGSNQTWTAEAWQYDYGQVLQIEGLELPDAYEVHFSNTPINGNAKPQIGNAEGVEIPDEYFESGEPIYAWLFLHQGEDDGETEKMVTIPIKKRSKEVNEQPTPVEQSAITQAIAALNIAVEKAEDAIEHYPQIISGTWHVWDVTAEEYVDTGVEAQGEQGQPGTDGTDGQDGFSPVITVTDITGGHRVTITDATGTQTFDVMNGQPGTPGRDGTDGYSPTVTVTEITGGHRVTITDAQGAHIFDVMDGQGGSVTVDSALSTTSENPVQNKVITEAVSQLNEDLSQLQDTLFTDETRSGDYFAVTEEEATEAHADAAVIVGNKNLVKVETNDVVGQTYTMAGITRVRNADDSYTFTGVGTRTVNTNLALGVDYLPAGTYTLSGCPQRGTGQKFSLIALIENADGSRRSGTDTGNGVTFTIGDGYSIVDFYFSIPNGSAEITTPITVKLQVERTDTASAYVKSENHEVAANEKIEINDTTYIFSRNSFNLALRKSAIDKVLVALDTEVDRIDGEINTIESTTLKPFPTISMDTARMVTITDGADDLPLESFVVNLDYSDTPRTKLRAFVSSENLFNIDDIVTREFITKNADGSLTPNGTVSIYSGIRGSTAAVPTDASIMDRILYLPVGTYYFITDPTISAWLYKVDPTTGGITSIRLDAFTYAFTIEEDCLVNIIIRDNVSAITITKDLPAATYIPNPGKTYVIPFTDTDGNAFTMYGGTVDVINGIATETYDASGNVLATPIIHYIDPVKVTTILGYNHIWSDGTSVSVTYRADIKEYVDQRNKSELLSQYNIDASVFGNVRNELFMQEGANVIAVAHRGLSSRIPENTMPAYKAAVEAGFLVAETDVDWTSDGVPILLHDSTINRTARNADGTEISSTISIRDITYAQALEYDFGIWKGEEYAGTKIPTFNEFILFCKRAGLLPLIELKYNQQTFEQTLSLIQTVIAHGMINRVAWVSNFKDLLLHVLSVHQGANVQLVASSISDERKAGIQEIKEKYPAVNLTVCCGIDYVTSADYEYVKEHNLPMNIWTIDNSATIRNLDPYITSITSNLLNAATVLKEAAMS